MKATEMQRLPVLLLAVFLFFVDASAQKDESTLCPASNDRDQWRTVSLSSMELCLPSYLQKVPVKCFEGGCYRFAGKDISLDIELHNPSGRPSWEKLDPSYTEKFIEVNGREAT